MDGPSIERSGRFLVARFARPHRMLSYAIVGGGFVERSAVAWCGVRNDELTPPVDPRAFLAAELDRAGLGGAVGLMTGASLDTYVDASRAEAGIAVQVVTTVGLDNALRAGDPVAAEAPAVGTINVLCRASVPLTDAALLEMLAMVAEARTLAVLDAGVASRQSGRPATGTGTDCTVVAAPLGARALEYAGKHTVLGMLVGAAVFEAVSRGARAWLDRHGDRRVAGAVA
jgi:adenosylcobinamide amidohydrolase